MADTEIYFIRHADVDINSKKRLLTDAGKERAKQLVSVFDGKPLTHILVTDFPRTKNTAKPLANERDLDVTVIPYKGKKATKPMVKALKKIPDGSSVLVVANSSNLFPIMSKMGVATNESMPCDSKKCFDRQVFDNIWHVKISGSDVSMTGLKY
jgi:phosphohistidine phosphatase SixA